VNAAYQSWGYSPRQFPSLAPIATRPHAELACQDAEVLNEVRIDWNTTLPDAIDSGQLDFALHLNHSERWFT